MAPSEWSLLIVNDRRSDCYGRSPPDRRPIAKLTARRLSTIERTAAGQATRSANQSPESIQKMELVFETAPQMRM